MIFHLQRFGNILINSLLSADMGALSCFVQSLKQATPSKDNVLTIEASRDVAKWLGISTWKENKIVLLIRKDYERLWHDISATFQEQNFISNFLVTGTSGVGKSLFRWYLVWMWINDALSIAALQFDQIRINVGKDFYLIQKDGRVTFLDKDMIWRDARSSLALFDPCEQLTNEKNFSPEVVVVTSSPSHVVGQVGKYSLTEFVKLAIIFVSAIWTLDELLLIMPNVDQERLEKFGLRIGSTTLCIPRWFFYRKQDIQGYISASWDHTTKNALRDYFLKGPDDEHKNKNLPYRLCTIEQNGDNDWKVTGFISDYVAGLVYDWAIASIWIEGRS